jgi:hypothetical protein
MSKKRLIVGIIFIIIFLPVFIAGVMFDSIQRYFNSGKDVGGDIFNWLDKKLGE